MTTLAGMPFVLDTDLPHELAPLAWLIGRWEGAGVAGYPDVESVNFGQEVECRHEGGSFLTWSSQCWELDADGNKQAPLASETGYWRPSSDDKPEEVELLLAHPTGIIEMYAGAAETAKIQLRTDAVLRSPSAMEYTAANRLYGYVNSNLMWAMDMAARGHPMSSHMSAELKRVE